MACLILGVSLSNQSGYQKFRDINFLVFILNVFINIITLPWWAFQKVAKEENEINVELDRNDKN